MSIQSKSLQIVKAVPPGKQISIENLVLRLGIETNANEISSIAHTLERNGLVLVDFQKEKTLISLTEEGKEVIPYI
ncbi:MULTISPECIES: hypothetical protein [Flammeovirga]|uniref:MarR family transcriptional regulator n=1 Tax=Flammeovirga agarivorans TaxID=2726742 RepID=A0A7X8SKX4_9BACT|nr:MULTISPECIES: hypothetical protein [Flammeovirga]NLR92121.1 hypothetical protein [Flammeovirga agarivorans]